MNSLVKQRPPAFHLGKIFCFWHIGLGALNEARHQSNSLCHDEAAKIKRCSQRLLPTTSGPRLLTLCRPQILGLFPRIVLLRRPANGLADGTTFHCRRISDVASRALAKQISGENLERSKRNPSQRPHSPASLGKAAPKASRKRCKQYYCFAHATTIFPTPVAHGDGC